MHLRNHLFQVIAERRAALAACFHTHYSPLQPPLEGALLDVFGAGFSVWPICCFAAAHASMSLPPSVFAPANWLLVRRVGTPGAHSFWL